MSRKRAKLMTAIGLFACTISLLLFVFAKYTANVLQILLPVIFVGGLVLIFLSLAYYTEK